jgi:hypothetical protein
MQRHAPDGRVRAYRLLLKRAMSDEVRNGDEDRCRYLKAGGDGAGS